MKKAHLKPTKEKAVLRRHPWIFSGAIQKKDPDISDGEILSVCDSAGQHLGYGYYNSKTRIAIRMLAFGSQDFTNDYLRMLIRAAVAKRATYPSLDRCDSKRIIFSEGDFLPGLIADAYGRHLVVQYLTLGMDMRKNLIAEMLMDELNPESIYERSDHEGRALEGMKPCVGQVYGSTPAECIVHENDMSFAVNIREGQKTGFYLDQRDNRAHVAALAKDRNVLNLFSYTGGFSVAAGLGGARKITSVDASQQALDLAEKNMSLNRLAQPADYVKADVFRYVREQPVHGDFIILDPPALAKNKASVQDACRGYKDLHLNIAAKSPSNAFLLTCSCSRFINMELFQMLIFEGFSDAGRNASIIGKFFQPPDHPTSLFCPETEYLKGVLLIIE